MANLGEVLPCWKVYFGWPSSLEAMKGCKVIADFSVHPIGKGTSVSGYVKPAVEELKKAKGVRLLVTPMGTIMEADSLSEVLGAVRAAHEAVFRAGATRVSLSLHVDDRRDKPRRMEDKIAAVS